MQQNSPIQQKIGNPQQQLYKHHTNKNQYSIYLTNQSQTLTLKLTQKYTLVEWNCSVKKQTLLQISKKTGHQLAPQKFIQIFKKALTQREADCYIDILTTQDLETLKNKKSGTQPKIPEKSSNALSKRYIILTYVINQNKYHYPLSLAPTPLNPPLQQLKQIYNELRIDLQSARTCALNETQKSESFSINYNNQKNKNNKSMNQSNKIKQIDQAKSQNQILKAKLNRLEEQVQKKKANIQIQAAIQRTKMLKQSYQTCNGELVNWRNSIQTQEQVHGQLKKQLGQLHKKICALLQTQKQVNAKKKGEEAGKQLNQVKNTIKKNTQQIETTKKQLQHSKNRVKQLQIKAKKLNSQKQVIKKGRRGPYSFAGSVRSYQSYNSFNSSKRSSGSNLSASSKARSNYSYSYNKRR